MSVKLILTIKIAERMRKKDITERIIIMIRRRLISYNFKCGIINILIHILAAILILFLLLALVALLCGDEFISSIANSVKSAIEN